MARASYKTILSLDRYAKILGINPCHFAGGANIELADGRVLFPLDNAQNNIWPQFSWQNFDQVSREDLAFQIAAAEQEIYGYLGYHVAPTWIEAERYDLPRHYRPETHAYHMITDVAGNDRQILLRNGKFIAGGRRNSVLVDGGIDVVYSDVDNDGWDEIATISFAFDPLIDPSEIKLYFAGYVGKPEYEIREPKSKTAVNGTLTFVYYTWQLVDPKITDDDFPTSDTDAKHINMNDPLSFVSTVDAYREYNDVSQPHAVFVSTEPDLQVTVNGFIYHKHSDNFVIPVQGTYDAENKAWTQSNCVYGYTDYVDLWYYAGMKDTPYNINADKYLSDQFARAIAYMATARLERGFYANNNATSLADQMRRDLSRSVRDEFIRPPQDVFTNPFGTKRGEYEAWKIVNRIASTRKVGGSL
jgi:hypothetical protein